MVLASLLYAALTNSKTAAAAKKKAEAYANATGPLPKLCRDCTTSIHMGCHAAKHGFFHRIFNCLMPMIALLPAVEENDQACLYGMGGGGGVLDFVRPILSDVISTSHSWRTIMCSRCSGDAGMCSHRSNFSGVPRQFAMESGWNYTSLSSGNFMATSGNATEGPQALLRRYLGRRAWPFFADPRMERRAVVLIVRKGGGRVHAMAAATQSCLGPLERGLPWPLLERANESQRVVLPGMEDTGIAYLDRVDLHTLRHAAARHGAANRQPSIDEQLHWNIDEQLH